MDIADIVSTRIRLCIQTKYSGHLEVVTFLVDAGASINIADNVSTRIRLCIQTKYNPYLHCNNTITIK